jgi:hypothetical protein
MTLEDAPHYRLQSQQISNPHLRTPTEVLSWLGAIQGQDYSGALWSIGLRLPHAARSDVEQAFTDRTIVRSWLMRGTLHFAAAEDIRWMLKLTAPRNITGQRARDQQLGLDEKIYAHCYGVLAEALQGGKILTRSETLAALEQAGISTQDQRGYHILKRAGQDCLLCFGPTRDKQQTFVLLDEWLPKTRELSREEALAKLARQYFRGRGPATLQDFIWWSGLLTSEARNGFESIKRELQHETIDGKEYWLLLNDSVPEPYQHSVYLLPGFDEYILGYKDRSAVLEPQYNQRICPGGNGMFISTVVIDGQVLGMWKRTVRKSVVEIATTPFNESNGISDADIEMAARKYQAFL